jgi:hypothetical protein
MQDGSKDVSALAVFGNQSKDTMNTPKIDWEDLLATSLDTSIAKRGALRITDHNALDQVATALHEGLHLIYAVKHGYAVISVSVAPSPKGYAYRRNSPAKGYTVDDMPHNVLGSVESFLAAAIFECELDPRDDNYTAGEEEKLALGAAQKLLWTARNNPVFVSDVGLLYDAFTTVAAEYFGFFSPLIITVAKAILFYRKGKSGTVPSYYTDLICKYVSDYLAERLPDNHYFGRIQQVTQRLRTTATAQNDIAQKQYDKWMRENDLDTILEILSRKQQLVSSGI